MLPGENGRDNVIIGFACISDLHSKSVWGLRDSASAASGPSTSPLPRYNDGGILASPLLMTVCLVKVVEHFRLAYFSSPNTWGLCREGIRSNRSLGGTGEILTASQLPTTSELVDNISTMGSGIPPRPPPIPTTTDPSIVLVALLLVAEGLT